ncbi:MAG: HAMP domain-containing protein [Chitinophagaceae bacterium]|nr:HAMP domain-containing protein [Rubrivivax sp.]
MRPWLDTLFARMLLVHMAVALLVALLFAVFAMRQQAQTLARATAPAWVAALAPVNQGLLTLPRDASVVTTVQLLSGPPPSDAAMLPVYPRFTTLAAELRARGVPVRSLRVSGRTGEAVTWLEIGRGDAVQWVGVRGEFEGIDVRERGTIGISIGLAATLVAAWWLSRRVLRPVSDLRRAMRRFESEGELPAPVAADAPIELRELAQQFSELARQRHELDEQRRTMLAAISHDLRSPLGRIRMAAELLPDGDGVAPRRDTIVRNVQVADRLLGSFIDMARAEDAPLTERVDLCALVGEVAQGEADVRLGPLPEPAPWLEPADALSLERALRNLLDNARHHGAPPIELALRCEGREVVLSVRDQGPGIAAKALAEMQRPFTRGESSRLTPGTGLGLAIAQRTAHRHGGTLVLSNAAPGLRAELRLPWVPRRP